jgi:hypothetical protein
VKYRNRILPRLGENELTLRIARIESRLAALENTIGKFVELYIYVTKIQHSKRILQAAQYKLK